MGKSYSKGDELGYFAFGGSTVIALFPPGAISLDADLVTNSRKSLETYVRMGMRLGARRGSKKMQGALERAESVAVTNAATHGVKEINEREGFLAVEEVPGEEGEPGKDEK